MSNVNKVHNIHGVPKFRSGTLTVKSDPSLSQVSLPSASPPSLERNSASETQAHALLPSSPTLLEIKEEDHVAGAPLYDLDVELHASVAAQSHEKARRLLFNSHQNISYKVSTHGSIDLLNLLPAFRQRPLISSGPLLGTIDDACLLAAYDSECIVLGHSGQISPQVSLVTVTNHKSSTMALQRPLNEQRKPGVGAVASLAQPYMFVTGGHDRVVHLWNIDADFKSANPQPLTIRHTSLVTSLLSIIDTSHKLVSTSADCTVHLYDLSSERVVNIVKLSNYVYHAHQFDSPFCTLLEVAHRDSQFEIRDHRIVPEYPVQRFGYITAEKHGRFLKGDTSGNLFACGSLDGRVRLWDMRNLKPSPAETLCLENQKVIQTSFAFSRLVALSRDHNICLLRHSIRL